MSQSKSAFVKNSATSEGADRKAPNEALVEGFSDEKEIHSTPTPSRGYANMVEARCHQRVCSGWFSGLLRWRACTSCHTEFDCDRNVCANSHPGPNCSAAHHSATVRLVGFSKKRQSARRLAVASSDQCQRNRRKHKCIRRQASRSCGTNALSRPRIARRAKGVATAIIPSCFPIE